MSTVARIVEYDGQTVGRQVWTWCPGCESLHPFTIESDGKLNNGTTWDWDGNLERPTFSPSLLCYSSVHLCEGEHDPTPCPDYEACTEKSHTIGYAVDGALRFRFPEGPPDGLEPVYCCGARSHTKDPAWGNCHSFLRNGVWEFLSDSAHSLAGQHVPMVPLPDWCAGKDS